jgi:N-acetylneuraminic acid mutarotase
MKTKLLFITLLAIVCMNANAQPWIQKASVDAGRRSTWGCTINGKGYTGLGENSSGTYLSDFWEYDTLTNGWTKLSNYLGLGAVENTAFAVNGNLYVCLGVNSAAVYQTDLWEYNTSNNTWAQKTSFPGIARYGARAFVIGDSAYVLCGSGETCYFDDMYMYNPITDTWTQKANFPGGVRAYGTAFSIGCFGYFGLGMSTTTTEASTDFWKYDPTTDTWSAIANYPGIARSAPINFVINNKAYIGTGNDVYPTVYYNDFYVYDPVANEWQLLNTSNTIPLRTGAIAFSFGNAGYVSQGENSTGVLTDLWTLNANSYSAVDNYNNENEYLKIYPNPATDNLTIKSSAFTNNQTISVYDIQGQLLLQQPMLKAKTNIDISQFSKGLYSLKVEDDNSYTVKKFVKD